jgi:hypothetical protein
LGKSVQCRSPAVVWMIATGLSDAAGLGEDDAACATLNEQATKTNAMLWMILRMGAPKRVLANDYCTTAMHYEHVRLDISGFSETASGTDWIAVWQ